MHRSFLVHRKAVTLSLTPKNIREFLVCSERKQYRKNRQIILRNAAWHLLPPDVPFKHTYPLIPAIRVYQSDFYK